MTTGIVPFAAAHAGDAADLVAARYRDEREANPLVSDAYCAGAAIEPRLRALLPRSRGVAAVRDGRLLGFLVGMPITWRGFPTAYVPEYGHGADRNEAYALYRSMYAEAACLWVDDGRPDHLLTAFATDAPALDAYVSLGYGAVGTDALRGMDGTAAAPAMDIRRATPADTDLVIPLEGALRAHLAASPTFLPCDPAEPTRLDEAWLSDQSRALWLASHAGEPCAFLCMEGNHGQVLPTKGEDVASITGAYTVAESRGSGVGAALLNHALGWAREAGYTRCAVDFETANLPGSAFWLSKGFRPVTRSLYRHTHDAAHR